jgi:hypothetical protein
LSWSKLKIVEEEVEPSELVVVVVRVKHRQSKVRRVELGEVPQEKEVKYHRTGLEKKQ